MSHEKITALRQRAEAMAQARTTPQEALNLAKELKKADEFGTARRLLHTVRSHLPKAMPALMSAEAIELAQLQALCTYKDTNLDADKRNQQALAILKELGVDTPECRNKETLGLAGAIYKRMWESSGTLAHLHSALAFYRAGWERDPEHDLGWCGVNAAYVLDLLAFYELASAKRNGHPVRQAPVWEQEAKTLRKDLLVNLPSLQQQQNKPLDYWAHATLAEVHFGLKDYVQAGQQLKLAVATKPDNVNWTLQTTAKQLASIGRMQGVLPPAPGEQATEWHPAWLALRELLGAQTAAALELWRGKVGLALSGGGFRAALFHLGVLARLAECDVLRSVETLSTVSGGSIVGAHYYLELRELLQTRPDDSLTRADYVQLIQRMMDDSLSGVQKNLRVRALSNLWANLKMVFLPGYSRTMRMGDLYERHLFARVRDRHSPKKMRRLRDLPVLPQGSAGTPQAKSFKPRIDNWLRHAKVPNLMLNTTSLNSGHSWHFTARWMGEPPGLAGDEIDMNERYRRLYYDQAPSAALKDFPLAYAVAASSCVPAMFEPLALKGLYPGRTVRLVDGGVHDNQGMAALLDDDCNLIFCSDASGQMASQSDPSNGMLGAFWRADNVLQDRVREAQYRNVRSRSEGGALQGLFFIHMKQDLETAPIDFVGCQDPGHSPTGATCTPYGVDREIQRLLSEMRTDLDSFTEVEAYALMASGYLLTRHQLIELDAQHRQSGMLGNWGGFDVQACAAVDVNGQALWPFEPLLSIMSQPQDSADLRRRDLALQLKTGSTMFGRVWCLVGWLRGLAKIIGVVVVAALLLGVIWLYIHRAVPVPLTYDTTVGALLLTIGVPVALLLVPALKYLDPKRASRNALLGVVVAFSGFVLTHVHLCLFEPLLRRRGRLSRLLNLPTK